MVEPAVNTPGAQAASGNGRNVVEIEDLTNEEHVERELCLLKVRYDAETRAEIMDVNTIFRGKVVDITPYAMTFELTGPTSKVDAFINMMRPHQIVEVARSGRVAMKRNHVSANGTA